MEFYLTAIMLGLCLSAMALGIFITMKIFSIPDITTDGSYTLGAVITALLLTAHWPAWGYHSNSYAGGGICRLANRPYSYQA